MNSVKGEASGLLSSVISVTSTYVESASHSKTRSRYARTAIVRQNEEVSDMWYN